MPDTALAIALAGSGRRIVLTGASGWLGMATLELLEHALGDDLERRVACFGSSQRKLTLRSGSSVLQRPLADLASLETAPSWLLHLAFLTRDRAETMDRDEYRSVNRAIGKTVLDALDTIGTEAVFVASSGAAAKADDPTASASMRLYGALKREDEERFGEWAARRGRHAVIGRIFNLTGPYINKRQAYAIANFILDALAGRPIAVRADREVFRAYVAIRELMALVFALLADGGESVIRFDTGGQPMELEDVARTVARVLGAPGVERAAITQPVADVYVGDGDRYAALLAAARVLPVGFPAQVDETANFLAGQLVDVTRQ